MCKTMFIELLHKLLFKTQTKLICNVLKKICTGSVQEAMSLAIKPNYMAPESYFKKQ